MRRSVMVSVEDSWRPHSNRCRALLEVMLVAMAEAQACDHQSRPSSTIGTIQRHQTVLDGRDPCYPSLGQHRASSWDLYRFLVIPSAISNCGGQHQPVVHCCSLPIHRLASPAIGDGLRRHCQWYDHQYSDQRTQSDWHCDLCARSAVAIVAHPTIDWTTILASCSSWCPSPNYRDCIRRYGRHHWMLAAMVAVEVTASTH